MWTPLLVVALFVGQPATEPESVPRGNIDPVEEGTTLPVGIPVVPLDELNRAAELDPNAGYLNVSTTPWSRVFIDGQYRGVTPLARVVVTPGAHVLRLQNPELKVEVETRIDVRAGSTTWIRRGMAKGQIGRKLTWVAKDSAATTTGTLSVTTSPPVNIFVDGVPRGQTPYTAQLEPGLHFIWLVQESTGIEAAKRILVQSGQVHAIDLRLERGTGYLEVDVGGPAEVFVDGKPVGRAPLEHKLLVGPHEVVVKQASGLVMTQRVFVREGETVPVGLP